MCINDVYQPPSDMDSGARKAGVDATATAAEADGAKLAASTVYTEVKLKAEADATKAIEAHSVADKAIATAKANAALKATVVIVDAPEAKFEAISTAELLSVNTAFGGNLANTVTYRRCS